MVLPRSSKTSDGLFAVASTDFEALAAALTADELDLGIHSFLAMGSSHRSVLSVQNGFKRSEIIQQD
jgi:hypothetical protein